MSITTREVRAICMGAHMVGTLGSGDVETQLTKSRTTCSLDVNVHERTVVWLPEGHVPELIKEKARGSTVGTAERDKRPHRVRASTSSTGAVRISCTIA